MDDMDLGETPDLISIDGLFTDSAMVHTFRLTKTRDYFGKGEFAAVSGAEVTITDLATGEIVSKLDEDADALGTYHTAPDAKGTVGHAYQLDIVDGQNRYRAVDTLFGVSPIVDLYIDPFSFYEDWNALYLDGYDPADETNFYMWRIYFNDELYDDYKNVPYAEDKFINTKIEHIMLYYDDVDGGRDHITNVEDSSVVRVQQLAISREGYNFVLSLAELLDNGGMFDSPMAQVKTNVWRIDEKGKQVEKQTGFFMLGGIDEKTIVYKP